MRKCCQAVKILRQCDSYWIWPQEKLYVLYSWTLSFQFNVHHEFKSIL